MTKATRARYRLEFKLQALIEGSQIIAVMAHTLEVLKQTL
ncbi:hypothetical protein SAMN03159363_4342 [Variovorax sp. EL159]|nr:hypothetical protein SAMN03159363_4342 [Variovorax sp. EL159]